MLLPRTGFVDVYMRHPLENVSEGVHSMAHVTVCYVAGFDLLEKVQDDGQPRSYFSALFTILHHWSRLGELSQTVHSDIQYISFLAFEWPHWNVIIISFPF